MWAQTKESLVMQKKLVPHSGSIHNESWTPNQGLHIVSHLSSILSNENSHSHGHYSLLFCIVQLTKMFCKPLCLQV
jgi:hypothetical protein